MGISTDYDLGVTVLRQWLETQQHLPQKIENVLLLRFLLSCNGDLEKAKNLIDLHYTLRNKYAHIFIQRDPSDKATQNIIECTDMLVLPNLTPQGNKVMFYRLANGGNIDTDKFNFTEAIKVFFMLADARFKTTEPHGGGEAPIFDMAGFTFRHLSKVVLSSLRIYMRFTQEAQPIRLKEIHVINCSPFIDKILSLVKPLIKSEIFKMIKFHLPGSQTLYEYVPKEMLPAEYGGNAGTINEIKTEWIETMIKQREYLINDKY